MKADWFRGLEGQAKDDMEKRLRASYVLFDSLDGILDRLLEKEMAAAFGQEDFQGDWANKQAYTLGKIKSLNNVKDYIKDFTSD